MKTRLLRSIMVVIILGLVTGALALPTLVRAATFTVNSADDSTRSVDAWCSDTHCTLRGAINEANRNDGPDVIEFNIPGSSPHTIRLADRLPELRDDATTIAGDTQPGYSLDLTYASGLNPRGSPVVIVDGSLLPESHGLYLESNNNVIRGLKLVNFTADGASTIYVTGSRNRIEKNVIGYSAYGGSHPRHVSVSLSGEENTVVDNAIAGDYTGIQVFNGPQTIQGNLIGTEPSGNRALGENIGFGIYLDDSADHILIGGELPEERNVVSGFSPYGFGIEVGSIYGHQIINNYIGTNAAGNAAIPNWIGINLPGSRCTTARSEHDFCPSLEPTYVQGNVISSNVYGVRADTDNSVIRGNLIGTDSSGTTALGSQEFGIYSEYGRQLLIGGFSPSDSNLISGNGTGIYLANEAGNAQVFGNKIGTNLSGTAAIPNHIGVQILSSVNYLGTEDAASGNLISGNDIGVWIEGQSNNVRNNRIGTNAAGIAGIPNREGIRVVGNIATLSIDYGNRIAFNTSHGIHLENTINVFIYRNTIHSNGGDGIYLDRTGDIEPLRNRFRENSTYNNGGLGIRFASPDLNGGVESPTLTRVTPTSVDGMVCPGCLVEIFLSDRDPSGLGEGKTFLMSVEAGADGSFHADLARPLSTCDSITTTALSGWWTSSMFSEDVLVGPCVTPPPLTVWIFIILVAAGGGGLLAWLYIRRSTYRPFGPSPIVPGLLGGLIGAGIAVIFLALPVVHIEWPQGRQGGQAPPSAPACSQFINEALARPEDGKVFILGTDVLFELSPQPDPPGMQTRWFLDVTGPDNTTVSKMLSSNSISLSALGFDPKRTGVYFWTLRGERSKAGSNTWTPLCTDSVQRMFRIAAPTPAPPTATATVAPTPTPTVTQTPAIPTATLLQNAYCMRGPGATGYESLTTLFQGVQVPIEGRNQDGTWWYVRAPNSQARCWVAGTMVQTSGNVNGVPVVEAPPACWVYQKDQSKKCVSPCPEGAQPGGACKP
jgi:parallel beta-helix repeat protein